MENPGTTYIPAIVEARIRCLLLSIPLICLLLILSLSAPVISAAGAESLSGSNPAPVAVPDGEGNGALSSEQYGDGPVPAVPDSRTTGTAAGSIPGSDAPRPEGTVPSEEQVDSTPGTEAVPTIVDVLHASISRGIQGSATWMDSFFGDRRHDIESNRSFIRFRYNVFVEKDSRMFRKPDLQVRVVLPQMRERTHIILAGSPRQGSEFSAVESRSDTDGLNGPEERNASAAVQQTFFESARQNFSIRAGLKLHDNKPVMVLGPQYRILFPVDRWSLRFIEEAIHTSDSGWEARSTVDLERELPRNLFFRASHEWIWRKQVDGYVYAFLFMVGQPISPRKALEYEWVNVFATKPANTLNEVALRARYRQRIWRDWFFFEVTPQYRFPRDRSFKATPGVLFRFDLIFGNYPLL